MNRLVRQTSWLPKRLKTIRKKIIYAQIAQSVEQGTENPRVGGSIPPLGTTTYKDDSVSCFFYFLDYCQVLVVQYQ